MATATAAPPSPSALAATSTSSALQDDAKRQNRARRQQRRLQRQWISLIEQWTEVASKAAHAGYSHDDSTAETVSALIEQISHFAQQICRSVFDRAWLISAFQMAIAAVLLDIPDGRMTGHPHEQLTGVPSALLAQLGQQLLQLAIHSVARPYLEQLDPQYPQDAARIHEWARIHPQPATVLKGLKEFELLAQRLSDYQLLVSLNQDAENDRYLLSACLCQEAPSLLLLLAQRPRAGEAIKLLLQHDEHFLSQAHPFRLAMIAALLRAGRTKASTLEQLDLFVGYKDGKETGPWSDQAASPRDEGMLKALNALDLPQPSLVPATHQTTPKYDTQEAACTAESLVRFYIEQARELQQSFALFDLALDLCQAVNRNVQTPAGSPILSELDQLEAELATLRALSEASVPGSDESPAISALTSDEVVKRLLQAALQQVDVKTPESATAAGTRAIESISSYAKTRSAEQISHMLVDCLLHMLDSTNSESACEAQLLIAGIVQLLATSTNHALAHTQAHLVGLLFALLYRRGGNDPDRIGLTTSPSVLRFLAQALETTRRAYAISSGGSDSSQALQSISNAVRRAPDTAFSARQIYAQFAADSVAVDANLPPSNEHISWLQQLQSILFGGSDPASIQNAKLRGLDLCWLLAFGGAQGDQAAQRSYFAEAVNAFASANLSSSSTRAGGMDVTEMRRRANWAEFVQHLPVLIAPDGPLGSLTSREVAEIILAETVKAGDLSRFRSLLMDRSVTNELSDARIERAVLSISTELYDKAPLASTRSGEMKLANEVLDALPASTSIKLQKNFIEATCRLCSFRIRSHQSPSKILEAQEVRATEDRMTLISRLLAHKEDAYKSPELVLELASKLCAVGPGLPLSAADIGNEDQDDAQLGLTASQKALVEIRTLAMLADAATAASDFEEGAGFCTRLVEKVGVLRKRAQAQQHNTATITDSTTPSGKLAAGTALSILPEALELGWKTCYQLSKHPGWEDTPNRLTLLSNVLTLCPSDRLATMLKAWKKLDDQLAEELKQGKTFASTKKAGWLSGPSSLGATAAAGGFAPSDAASAAAAAASVGAGLVGMGANAAANLLPLSFSPLSYFGGSAMSGSASTAAGSSGVSAPSSATAAAATARSTDGDGGFGSRAARLFDFDSSASSKRSSSRESGGYLSLGVGGRTEAAERAARAARAAARNFLGGWTSASSPRSGAEAKLHEDLQEQGRESTQTQAPGQPPQQQGGFSFTRGVGWLIGEDHASK